MKTKTCWSCLSRNRLNASSWAKPLRRMDGAKKRLHLLGAAAALATESIMPFAPRLPEIRSAGQRSVKCLARSIALNRDFRCVWFRAGQAVRVSTSG